MDGDTPGWGQLGGRLQVESVEKLEPGERTSKDVLKEKLLHLEAKISDQSKDIIWYRTQAKSFNKANQDLQKKLIELEDQTNISFQF